jgi:hypothetical protein
MRYYLFILFCLLFTSFVSAGETSPKTSLTPGGCLVVGSIVKTLASVRGKPEFLPGKYLEQLVIQDLPFKDLPEDLKTLLKLVAVVVVKSGPQETPEEQEEEFNEFCFEAKGEVKLMNQVIKAFLGVEEKEI